MDEDVFAAGLFGKRAPIGMEQCRVRAAFRLIFFEPLVMANSSKYLW